MRRCGASGEEAEEKGGPLVYLRGRRHCSIDHRFRGRRQALEGLHGAVRLCRGRRAPVAPVHAVQRMRGRLHAVKGSRVGPRKGNASPVLAIARHVARCAAGNVHDRPLDRSRGSRAGAGSGWAQGVCSLRARTATSSAASLDTWCGDVATPMALDAS